MNDRLNHRHPIGPAELRSAWATIFQILRHPLLFLDEAITSAQTCPGCGCNADTWRKDCGCTRHDCECSDSFRGPDTDFDDTFDYTQPGGPAAPASGKWWLRGKCSMRCADVNCPPNGPCQREERYLADQLPPASFPWLNGTRPPTAEEDVNWAATDNWSGYCEDDNCAWAGPNRLDPALAQADLDEHYRVTGHSPTGERDEDRAMSDTVPTDGRVQQLSDDVDNAFAERERLWDIHRDTGLDEDEAAMLRQDALAADLLDQYNAAVQAQRAESDRRRDINVATHSRDLNVCRGDLAAALQCDDWLEDHGVPADERRTCRTCRWWADHAHDPITGGRVEDGPWTAAAQRPDTDPWPTCGRCGAPMQVGPRRDVSYDEGDGGAMVDIYCPTCNIHSYYAWAMSDQEFEEEFGYPFGERPDDQPLAPGDLWQVDICREPGCGGYLDEQTNTRCTKCGQHAYEFDPIALVIDLPAVPGDLPAANTEGEQS